MSIKCRKGLILAGGTGSRLYPLTVGSSKQLMAVYDKPMIYYPLSVLMLAGVRDILVICTCEHISSFKALLGDGQQWGISIEYRLQDQPNGIAEAFLIGEQFINGSPCVMILGDNIFYGAGLPLTLKEAARSTEGASVFAYRVENPQDYGVVEFDKNGVATSIKEKPSHPDSDYAITGLYFYDKHVCQYARSLTPSPRGELEISDLNRIYLDMGKLTVSLLGRGNAWLDTGTHDSLLDASNFVKVIEKRQGQKIACIEEIAWLLGFIDDARLEELAQRYNNSYGRYIKGLLKNRPEES